MRLFHPFNEVRRWNGQERSVDLEFWQIQNSNGEHRMSATTPQTGSVGSEKFHLNKISPFAHGEFTQVA